MPSFCAVANCNDKYGHAESISFHRFPFKRKDLLQLWKEFAQRDANWMPSKWSAICSRHFLESDFNCINERKTLKKTAVPTVRIPVDAKISTNLHTQHTTDGTNCNTATCRLCGIISKNCTTFANNFEIFGMIQKCFPTLQIQQNDALPKDMCGMCYKTTERFARFIDKVLETQSELQRKYSLEQLKARQSGAVVQSGSGVGSVGIAERHLKIKQEPLVRVKQEIAEGLDCLFSEDLDIGMEDACEQDQPDDEIEQKFQFCDFPVLNAQDIINNCDIMEIINLDDPFINITDDDAAQSQASEPSTATAAAATMDANVTPSKQPTIGELLQTELLIEEHNYANPIEELKEQWQIKNQQYKTEKLDSCELSTTDITSEVTVTSRSSKPIVTNVSQITNPLICDFLPDAKQDASVPIATSGSKPNIVVLNDSIVKSSDAFTLHTCTICGSKFFTNDSLNQHYDMAHGSQLQLQPTSQLPPMVSVPSVHVSLANNMATQNLKVEANVNSNASAAVQAATQPNELPALTQEYWPTDYTGLCSNMQRFSYPTTSTAMHTTTATINHACTSVQTSTVLHNPINILDMQQSYMRQTDYGNLLNTNGYQLTAVSAAQTPAVAAAITFSAPTITTTATTTTTHNYQHHMSFRTATDNAPNHSEQHLATVTENYVRLQQRFRLLQRKCRHLERNVKKLKYRCCRCSLRFRNICALLRHKQQQQHYVPKPHQFSGKCFGCQRHHRTRLALAQHMRYICQSLPLRCIIGRLQSFKCRYCQAITFTHWRLYRRHALKCRLKLKKRKRSIKAKLPKSSKLTAGRAHKQHTNKHTITINAKPLPCAECGKLFANMNSLNQHRITHSTERKHKCPICGRVFKRRNGLSQHIRGYHYQIKPYECPVCKHCYALKADMMRCRHSLRRVLGE